MKINDIIHIFQLLILYPSYYFFFLFKILIPKVKFVIGTDEIAKNIHYIGKILNNSITVCLHKDLSNYDLKYNFFVNIKNNLFRFIYRIFYGPILLGYLANKANIFFYIWSKGFLINRKHEFKFLKSRNKKIVCLFVGSDIRSVKLTKNYCKKHKIDHPIFYRKDLSDDKIKNVIFGPDEERKKYLAKIADCYADLIFSHSLSSISYLKSKQHRWYYIYDKRMFHKNDKKFHKIKKINIIHAPSNYIYKGTPLVRAAIKKLQLEGYNFNYKEFNSVNNKTVIKYLKSSHIVLNQFYDVAPGLLGIEAMANHCAVMMSAEPKLITSKTKAYEDTWMVTKYWQIYDNLKYLLENPDKIKNYADKSHEFVSTNFTYENAANYLNKKLKENKII